MVVTAVCQRMGWLQYRQLFAQIFQPQHTLVQTVVFTRQFSFLGSAVFQKDNRSGKELSYNEEVQREMEKLRREYQIKREKFLDLYGSVPPNMTEEQQVEEDKTIRRIREKHAMKGKPRRNRDGGEPRGNQGSLPDYVKYVERP